MEDNEKLNLLEGIGGDGLVHEIDDVKFHNQNRRRTNLSVENVDEAE